MMIVFWSAMVTWGLVLASSAVGCHETVNIGVGTCVWRPVKKEAESGMQNS